MSVKLEIKMEVGRLDNLAQTLEDAESSYLKVGVLGDYAGRIPGASGVGREKSDLTNPQLAMWHEFGTFPTLKPFARGMGPTRVGLPERSFLRMPLWLKLPSALQNMGSDAAWGAFLMGNGIVKLLDLVGNECVGIIADAFHTGGFGNWAPLKRRTILRKKNSDILIDSGKLQRSVTYAVVRRGASTVSIAPVVP
jgi:hypothetical protein